MPIEDRSCRVGKKLGGRAGYLGERRAKASGDKNGAE